MRLAIALLCLIITVNKSWVTQWDNSQRSLAVNPGVRANISLTVGNTTNSSI